MERSQKRNYFDFIKWQPGRQKAELEHFSIPKRLYPWPPLTLLFQVSSMRRKNKSVPASESVTFSKLGSGESYSSCTRRHQRNVQGCLQTWWQVSPVLINVLCVLLIPSPHCRDSELSVQPALVTTFLSLSKASWLDYLLRTSFRSLALIISSQAVCLNMAYLWLVPVT